ncbi:MAG: hypothetical protein EBT99_15665 [Betaproteobacteria bacterium]|nr:hypothetical protein [Betaproteobacteria bacterium]
MPTHGQGPIALLTAVVVSFGLTMMIRVLSFRPGGSDSSPRLGGLSLFLGLLLVVFATVPSAFTSGVNAQSRSEPLFSSAPHGAVWTTQILMWLLMLLPIFLIGLVEDLKGNLTVRLRFWVAIIVGIIFTGLGPDRVVELDLPFLKSLGTLGMIGDVISFAITTIAIAGYTHAMNIVDGLHGLASGAAILMLIGLGVLATSVGAIDLAIIAFLICALSIGFFLINFPKGSVYLGDCGAYFLGFFIAALAIALPARHSEISPWASLVICSYPVIEVFFSIIRRWRGRGRSAGQADRLHLHSLLHRRVFRSNPKATLFILIPVSGTVLFAVIAVDQPLYLQLFFVLTVFAYVSAYRRTIRSFIASSKQARPARTS